MNEAEPRNDEGPSSVTFASGLSWTRVALPRLLSRIGKTLFVFGALGMLAMVFPSQPLFGLATLLGAVGWLFFLASYIVSLTQTSFGGGLIGSKDELVILKGTTRRVIPIAKIAGALVVERMVGGVAVPTVEIELTNGDRLTARIPAQHAPELIVRTLGFGPGGRKVHAALAKPTRRLLHPLFAFAAYAACVTVVMLCATAFPNEGNAFELAFAAYPPVTLFLYALLQHFVRAPEVTVGDDGVAMRVHGRTRMIARRDIAFVGAPLAGVLAVEEHSGKRTAITSVLLDHARVAAVTRLIGQRAGPSAATADRFVHYDRAGRALAAWRDHLAHAMNDASYRHNAATVDEAASVLRSGQATPEQRIGAALALRVAGQPPERIRVAAASAVDERVRVALEAVADAEDDVVIEKALKRLQS
jgi:hypothetical protein